MIKFAKVVHYTAMHTYAILGLLMGLYFIIDTTAYHRAMFEVMKTQAKMLVFIASKLTGMTS